MNIITNKTTKIIATISIIVVLMAASVILGWFLDIEILKSIIPSYATMKFNTALGLALSGFSLYLISQSKNKARVSLSSIFALSVFVIGGLTFLEGLFKVNLGIDQLFVSDLDSIAANHPVPGRMSQLSAVCFILLSSSFLLIKKRSRTQRIIGQVLLDIVTLLSFIAIMGYLYSVPNLYKLSFLTSMAIHTALIFFILSVTASFLNPSLGITNLFTGKKLGNKMAISLFSQLTIIILVLTYIRLQSHRNQAISVDFGTLLFALSFILISLFLIWRTSRMLNRLESNKYAIEGDLLKVSAFLNATPDPIVIVNENGIIQVVNEQTETVFGYKKEELINQPVEKLLPKRFQGGHVNHRKDFNNAPKARSMGSGMSLFALKKDGTEIPVEVSLNPVKMQNKVWVSAAIRDITKQQKLQEDIRKSREQFMTFFNMSPVATSIATFHDSKIWYANDAFLNLFHFDKSIIGKTSYELNLMTQEDRDVLRTLLNENKMKLKGFETRLNDKFGNPVSVIVSIEKVNISGTEYLISSMVDITERLVAESKFKELSNRLKLATNNSSIGIWDYDLVNNSLIWDEIMFKVFGIEKDVFSADLDAWESVVHPDDIEQAIREMQMAIAGEKEFDTEFRIIWPSDQSIHFIRAKGQVYHDDSGNPIRMLGTNWDVTAQRLAQEEMERSNQRNQIFVEQAPSALAMFDKNMCYMAASKQWIKDYNITEKKIIGKSHYEIFPEIGDDWKKHHQECLKGATNQCDEAVFEREDGSKQWITWDIRPWYVTKDTIGGLIIYTADITHLKQKEIEKRKIEEILDKTNEVARIGTWEVDLVTNSVSWSRITKEIHEVSPNFVPDLTTGINFYKLGASRKKIEKVVGEAIEKGTPFDAEFELVTAKGNAVWVRSIGQAEFEKGKCIRLYGIFQDINEIKTVENTLNKANEELKAIFNTQSVSIIGTDPKGLITHFNKGAEEFLQYSAEEMVGKQTPAIIHIEDEIVQRGEELSSEFGGNIAGFDVFVEMAKRGATETREWTYKRKDGSTYAVLLSVTAVTENDKTIGYLGVGVDISQIKATQKELALKNEELEQFAYIAAHDLQEPLRTISSFLSLLKKKYANELDDKAKQYIQFSVDGALRMKALIEGILDFSKAGNVKQDEVNLETLVNEIVFSLKSEEKYRDAIFDVQPLPVIKADETAMIQLFSNLISNGLKYQPEGNNPIIKIDSKEEADQWLFIISDNGLGIAPKHYEKVFAVFKRLHSTSEYAGTGIGLATCKKIVNKYGGDIWIKPNIKEGTIFMFTLKK
ncbi:PAS domain S-box protein [Roseivirga echinicomitans]|uniref:histidine kinase n=1 Tax=Roseivirga echinicomitans TaxID=296218 RepID=A0A150XU34_9BACT|nr:PAS domain S-box protein [Roseivirga echinicomitans]KYG82250.1 hypothetical protein AWN68_15525 [Roseivirga echinicomitans]